MTSNSPQAWLWASDPCNWNWTVEIAPPKQLSLAPDEIIASVKAVLNADPIIDDRIGEDGVDQLAQAILRHLIDRQK